MAASIASDNFPLLPGRDQKRIDPWLADHDPFRATVCINDGTVAGLVGDESFGIPEDGESPANIVSFHYDERM